MNACSYGLYLALVKPLMKKYKALRNECNRLIRQEATTATAERIVKSGNPSSVWQEVRNILNPKSSKKISLKIDGVETSEDERVADLFNKYFIAKIEKLRNDIDPKYIESPTKRLKKSLNERRSGTLQLRTVKEAEVIKALHDLKPKKSSGMDGVSQKLLKSISSLVSVPLTLIINTSINTGVFPSPWKKSKITPISKGGGGHHGPKELPSRYLCPHSIKSPQLGHRTASPRATLRPPRARLRRAPTSRSVAARERTAGGRTKCAAKMRRRASSTRACARVPCCPSQRHPLVRSGA